MDWNIINSIASVASITGLGASIAQWLDSRRTKAQGDALASREATVQEYLEWLRRKHHSEITDRLDKSHEAIRAIDILIRGLNEQSEARLRECINQMEKSTESFKTLLRRFAELERRIALFAEKSPESAEEREFETEYLRQVKREFSRLRIVGVRETHDVKQHFGIAYVSLTMSSASRGKGTRDAEEALRDTAMMTIRGAAGSGKTTLLSWVALECARIDEDIASPWAGGVPFFVPLRKLDKIDRRHPNMSKFVEYTIDPKLCAMSPPRRWLQNVLDARRGVVLIDGVDELPPGDRPDFWRWLDDFVDLSPGNRVYITSRFFPDSDRVNWELLWNPPRAFASASLDEMNDATVTQFIRNWHDAVVSSDLDPKERLELEQAKDLLPGRLRELANQRVRELCRTPLLCALVCALHWRESGYLPRQRVDLYDRCCSMLIDERDVKRDIPLPDGSLRRLGRRDKELLLQRLALDMMRNCAASEADYSIEVARSDAISWLAPNIKLLDDNGLRECSPEEILDYLMVRSGVLREPSLGRVDFAHRTFQEYLAACAVGALNQVGDLVARTDDDQWHETIVLSAGTKVGGVVFGNALVKKLVSKGEEAKYEPAVRRTCFALAVACLETGHQLDPALRTQVLSHLREIVPPRDSNESRTLAAAGDAVLPFLVYERWRSEGVATVAACAHTVAMIGSRAAIEMLLDPHGYGNDRRSRVLARICECWAIDPIRVPRVARILADPLQELPYAVRPFIRQLDAILPEKGTTAVKLQGYSGISDLGPLAGTEGVRILELRGMHAVSKLDPVASLNNLTLLRIVDCPNIVDLSPLAGLRELRQLELVGLPRLEDLSPLSRLTSLQRLMLRGLRNLDLVALGRLLCLETLDLRASRSLENVEILNSLGSLSEVIVDQEVAPTYRSILKGKVSTIGLVDDWPVNG